MKSLITRMTQTQRQLTDTTRKVRRSDWWRELGWISLRVIVLFTLIGIALVRGCW